MKKVVLEKMKLTKRTLFLTAALLILSSIFIAMHSVNADAQALGCCLVPDSLNQCTDISADQCCGTDASCISTWWNSAACSSNPSCGVTGGCCELNCLDVTNPVQCKDASSNPGYLRAGVSCSVDTQCTQGCYPCTTVEGNSCFFGAFKTQNQTCIGLGGTIGSKQPGITNSIDCANSCGAIIGYAWVAGYVRNTTGSALDGATVTIGQRTGVTGSDGSFNISQIPLGDNTLVAEKDGFISTTKTISVTTNTSNVQVLMSPAPFGALSILVKDQATGLGMTNIPVTVGSSSFSRSGVTTGAGTILFSNLPIQKTYYVSATLVGYNSLSPYAVDLNNTGTAQLTIVMNKTQTAIVSGHVRSGAGYIPGVSVSAVNQSFQKIAGTDATGYFVFNESNSLFFGSFAFTASKEGYNSVTQNAVISSASYSLPEFNLVPKAQCLDGTYAGECSLTQTGQGKRCNTTSGGGFSLVSDTSCPCQSGYTKINGVCTLTGDACTSTCTLISDQNTCKAQCNGVNQCSFPDDYVANQCNGKQIGTVIPFNSTFSITCCNAYTPNVSNSCGTALSCSNPACDNKGCGIIPAAGSIPATQGVCSFGKCYYPKCDFSTCEANNTRNPCYCGPDVNHSAILNSSNQFCCANSMGRAANENQCRLLDGCSLQSSCKNAGGECYPFGCQPAQLIAGTNMCGTNNILPLSCCQPGQGATIATDCCESPLQCSPANTIVGATQCAFGLTSCKISCNAIPSCFANKAISDNSGLVCRCGSSNVDINLNLNKYCCFGTGVGILSDSSCTSPVQTGTFKATVKIIGSSNGISGAAITLSNTDGSSTFRTISGGMLQTTVPVGTYDVSVSADGYASQNSTLTIYLGFVSNVNYILTPNSLVCAAQSTPKVDVFNLSSVRGKKAVQLTWQAPCPNVLQYAITRVNTYDPSSFVSFTSSSNTFLDNSPSLMWNTNYTYYIQAVYAGYARSAPTTATILTGNYMCQDNYGEFCISNQEGMPTIRVTCDVNNQIIDASTQNYPADCSRWDETANVECTKILGDGITSTNVCTCAGPSSTGQTKCVIQSNCDVINQHAQPFGLFYTSAKCYGAENENYCYFDYSNTLFDTCNACSPTATCYSYKSNTACLKDSCEATHNFKTTLSNGSVQDDACGWQPISYTELGKGICYDPNYRGTDYCGMCNEKGNLFFNSGCRQDVCSKLGACLSNADNSSCNSCVLDGPNPTTCSAFTSKEACTGTGNQQNTQVTCDAQTGVQTITSSNDACFIGLCKWDDVNKACFKDGNGNSVDDCSADLLALNPSASQNQIAECRKKIQRPMVEQPNLTIPFSSIGYDVLFVSSTNLQKLMFCVSKDKPCCPNIAVFQSNPSSNTLRINPVNYVKYDSAVYTGPGAYHLSYIPVDSANNYGIKGDTDIYLDLTSINITFNYTVDTNPDLDQSGVQTSKLVINATLNKLAACIGKLRAEDSSDAIYPSVYDGSSMLNQTSDVFDPMIDGWYLYTLVCQDNVGNTADESINMLVDANHNIDIISPAHGKPIKETTVNFSITTTQPSNCKLFKGSDSPVMFSSSADGLSHSIIRDLYLNTFYSNIYVNCTDQRDEKSDKEYFSFAIDRLAPTLNITNKNTGLVYSDSEISTGVWLSAPADFDISCTDTPIPGIVDDSYLFGCDQSNISYCISDISRGICTPSIPGTGFSITTSSYACFVASDMGGNTANVKCARFLFDGRAPVANITSPIANFSTRDQMITVVGTVNEANLQNISLIVSNLSENSAKIYPVDYTYSADLGLNLFNARINLSSGENDVFVYATDQAGNYEQPPYFTAIYRDLDGPQIGDYYLAQDMDPEFIDHTGSRPIEQGHPVYFAAASYDNYTSLTYSDNHAYISIFRRLTGEFIVNNASMNNTDISPLFTHTYLLNETSGCVNSDSCRLKVGSYTARIAVTDRLGNPSSDEINFTVTRNESPTIWFVRPRYTNTVYPNITIRSDKMANCTLLYVTSGGLPYTQTMIPGLINLTWVEYSAITDYPLSSEFATTKDNIIDVTCTYTYNNTESNLTRNITGFYEGVVTVDTRPLTVDDAYLDQADAFLLGSSINTRSYYLGTSNITKIYAAVDRPVRCKYSATTKLYQDMEYQFANFDTYSLNPETLLISMHDPSETRYYVRCEDYSGNVAQNYRAVNITVDVNGPIIIFSASPNGYINVLDPKVIALTMKNASCRVSESGNIIANLISIFGAQGMSVVGPFYHESTTRLALIENRTYIYQITCDDARTPRRFGSGSRQINFTADVTPPFINMTYPNSNISAVNQSLIDINGTTEPKSNISVYVNGAIQQIYGGDTNFYTENGVFANIKVALDNGSNTVNISVTDKAGNENSVLYVINVLALGPRVLWIEPNNGVLRTVQNITCELLDVGGGIDLGNTQIIASRVDGSTNIETRISGQQMAIDNTTLVFILNQAQMQDGTYRIVVVPVDRIAPGQKGESMTSGFTLNSRAPDISLLEPSNNALVGDAGVNFNGYVTTGIFNMTDLYMVFNDSQSGMGVVYYDFTGTVNNISSSPRRYSFNYTTADLSEGTNMTYYIAALDSGGNYGRTEDYTISIDRHGPNPRLISVVQRQFIP